MSFTKFLDVLLERERPFDTSDWHKWFSAIPLRAKNGMILFGPVLRRLESGKWVYKELKETEQEFLDRQY